MCGTRLRRRRWYALLGLSLLIHVLAPGASARAQQKAEKVVGRYDAASLEGGRIALIDTTTGACWLNRPATGDDRDPSGWVDLDFPVKDTKVGTGAVGRFRFGTRSQKDAVVVVVWDTADGRCWSRGIDGAGQGKDWIGIDPPWSK